MPGVLRPYNLIDVLATLNQQNTQLTGAQLISGLGDFAEADESLTSSDSASTSAQVPPGWDQSVWGAMLWS